MRSARLRHQVSLERQAKAPDPRSGQLVEIWQSIAQVWAAVEPLRGRELFTAQQFNSEVTTKITLRYLRGITLQHRMRVVLAADTNTEAPERIFTLLHDPIDPDLRHRELQLLCKEVI